jgi:diphosphomevalonate decarboxylase
VGVLSQKQATAWAHPNVALIKYWGKRDAALNLPATGSISLTLAGLTTRTHVCFGEAAQDSLVLNGASAEPSTMAKAVRVLDAVRRMAKSDLRASVGSDNDFPTGAGLASSASGFAALAVAAAQALGVVASREELSGVARLGSGSAARSLFGGFVEMQRGSRSDGSDAVATPLVEARAWPVEVVIAVASNDSKKVQSTAGMEHSRGTSPFWQGWLDTAALDLERMRAAVLANDFDAVGELAEHSCLKMHALALSAQPGLVYWNAATVAVIHAVRDLRRQGARAYFTIDAGPQVKVLCAPGVAPVVRAALTSLPGVLQILDSGPGEGVEVRAAPP